MNRTTYKELVGGKTRAAEEDAFQISVIKLLTIAHKPGVVWYMIRNHGKRSVAALKKDADMGLRKGASDLGLVIPPHGTAGMLELKWGKNTPTPDQERYGEDVQAAGGYYACVWDMNSAIAVLKAWGAIR